MTISVKTYDERIITYSDTTVRAELSHEHNLLKQGLVRRSSSAVKKTLCPMGHLSMQLTFYSMDVVLTSHAILRNTFNIFYILSAPCFSLTTNAEHVGEVQRTLEIAQVSGDKNNNSVAKQRLQNFAI
jgi:hypothetical protein